MYWGCNNEMNRVAALRDRRATECREEEAQGALGTQKERLTKSWEVRKASDK